MVKPLEEWRPIPGYESYVASSLGRIGSLKGRRATSRSDGIFVLRPFGQDGYARVQLSLGSQTRGRFVHQLVALAFHGEPPDGKSYVAHCNGNRADNRPENLRWASASDNVADRRLHNLPRGRDLRRGNTKLPEILKLAILHDVMAGGLNHSEISRKHGVSHTTVWRLARGERRGAIVVDPERVTDSMYEAALKEIERVTASCLGMNWRQSMDTLSSVRAIVLKVLATAERRGLHKEAAA